MTLRMVANRRVIRSAQEIQRDEDERKIKALMYIRGCSREDAIRFLDSLKVD